MISVSRVGITIGCAVLSAGLAFGPAADVWAQTSTAKGTQPFEEIVVTARRRSESLATAPVAVTVFTAEQLQASATRSLQDLSYRTPGLHFSNQAGQIPGRYNTAIRFRGMDTNVSAPAQQLGTAFIDGVYISNGLSSIDFSSIERVEVIRGPQSAQFGRSTFAGAVNYVTRTPSFTLRGEAEAQVGQQGLYDTHLSVEGPLWGDTVAGRISVRSYGDGGRYTSTTDGGALGRERTDSLMGMLLVQRGGFTLKPWVMFSRDNDGPPAAILISSAGHALGAGPSLANSFQYTGTVVNDAGHRPSTTFPYFVGNVQQAVRSAGSDWRRLIDLNTGFVKPVHDAFCNDSTFLPSLTGTALPKVSGVPSRCGVGRTAESWRVGLPADYEFAEGTALGGYRISALLGWSDFRTNYIRDFDLAGTPNIFAQDPQKYEHESYELRFASPTNRRLRYGVGLSYFKADYQYNGQGGYVCFDCQSPPGYTAQNPGGDPFLTALFGGPNAVIPGPPWFGTLGTFPIEHADTRGALAYVSFDILNQLTLDLEVRRQKDTLEQEPQFPGNVFKQSFTNTLPRGTLSFKPVPGTVVWATYSKGNLPGSFNQQLSSQPPSVLAQIAAALGAAGVFNEEEELQNKEIGWKQQLIDNRLFFSVVGYHMDWKRIKTRANVPVTLPNGQMNFLNVQANSGDAVMKGVEFETVWTVNDRLSAGLTANWAGGEYKNFTCAFSPFILGAVAGRADCSGNRPARFPDSSGSINATWTDKLSEAADYFVRVDGAYFGKAYNEEANFSWVGKFWRWDLRGGVEAGPWRVEAFVSNIFNDDNPLAGARYGDFSYRLLAESTNFQGLAITPPEPRRAGMRFTYRFGQP